jgi:hypothetical protein
MIEPSRPWGLADEEASTMADKKVTPKTPKTGGSNKTDRTAARVTKKVTRKVTRKATRKKI